MNRHNRIGMWMGGLVFGLLCLGGLAQAQEEGGAAPQPLADQRKAEQAQEALAQFLRAYEQGNLSQIRSMLDPSMIGYQRLLDGIQRDSHAYKQIRIHLSNTQVLAGPDVTVIQTHWEKRFLSATDLRPGLHSGESQFLLHQAASGWKIADMAGDAILASDSGSLAQLTFTPAALAYASLPVGATAPPPPMGGFLIEVLDPDLAGRGSLSIEFRSSQGDRENFLLTETSAGRFARTTLSIEQDPTGAATVVGDGRLFISSSPLPALVTMSYTDRNPGNGMPPRTLSRSIRVQ